LKNQFPLLGNLRNGLWYSPSYEDTCYFKSTDGHTYKWDFSLARLNVNVLKSAIVAGGVIIADSTRRGKSFPDALSKTIPIWCAVLNGFMAKHFVGGDACGAMSSAGTSVHLPPFLSPSEEAQINSNIPRWIASLDAIKDNLMSHITSVSSSLKVVYKPLRPVFVCPSYDIDAVVLEVQSLVAEGYLPVVCVSVSNCDLSAEEHRERHSWSYMQGAGDDEESWSQGLRPEVMWKHIGEAN
jgi:tRNA A64-2'-O-ribosylphosphate transferase